MALVGTFRLAAGRCDATTDSVSGSYFRLIFPGGTVANGPFFNNANARCSNPSYTTLRAGTQGGLVTGSYQPNPTPAFSRTGSALADDIVQPVSFTGIDLSVSTNQTDPQTRRGVPMPSVSLGVGGQLSAQLEALSIAWNKLYINQGSPKPGGQRPGATTAVTGS